MTDTASRFVFVDADVRGTILRLDETYREMTARHQYPAEVQQLLGEFLAAALLLGDTLKFEGRLTLQANGQGALRLMVAEATHERSVRGIAQLAETADASDFAGRNLRELLGAGTLTVTVEARGRDRYQSIVPLQGNSLQACLESYFQQSEQLNTFIRLASSGEQATGLLIQQLPVQLELDPVDRSRRWETIEILADTVTSTEMLNDSNEVLIRHLFAREEKVQLLGEQPVRFECSCSEERMAGALVSLGETELAEIFSEQPVLDLTCEFCGAVYEMTSEKLTRLLTEGHKPH